MVIAYMLEYGDGQGRIFEIYLNVVEFGRGVFGAEAAARHYFRVPAASLCASQAARLAVMLPESALLRQAPAVAYLVRRTGLIHGAWGRPSCRNCRMPPYGQPVPLLRRLIVPCFDLPGHGLVSTLALFLFLENPTWVVLFRQAAIVAWQVGEIALRSSPVASRHTIYGGRAHQGPYRPRSLICFNSSRPAGSGAARADARRAGGQMINVFVLQNGRLNQVNIKAATTWCRPRRSGWT